ncbi:GDSL esterase/lipase 7 [Phtheirospermum japonicum]|uniref:GDSL esterase/lipase 7 n=1 Tax=Phtheirospermum japonicum TaxID=374723 RepID=A0A830CTX0_9LAMI|nr:GDSL esterase/lipase 7 [Phtheirospermum japonicum]
MKKVVVPIISVTVVVNMLVRVCIGNNSNHAPPALYVFGDSIFDSGNNNLLPTLAKADFSPYGIDFERGPTGRFTNGRTVVDFIAEFLGLPYPPPYLSVRRVLSPGAQLRGLNFASGSCGILPETGTILGKCLNFDEQIGMFEKTVKGELARHYGNSDELSNYLAKSIFVISVGSNDYINNYIDSQHYDTSKRYTPQSYAQLLIHKLSQQFQRLYNLGARKVVMFEIGPIGCIPSTTRQFKHDGQCVEEINELALIFNDHLAPMLQNLTSTLPGSAFILGHAHWLGYDAAINPSKYGLKDSTTGVLRNVVEWDLRLHPGARGIGLSAPGPTLLLGWLSSHSKLYIGP